jgi:hypothetical protein
MPQCLSDEGSGALFARFKRSYLSLPVCRQSRTYPDIPAISHASCYKEPNPLLGATEPSPTSRNIST